METMTKCTTEFVLRDVSDDAKLVYLCYEYFRAKNMWIKDKDAMKFLGMDYERFNTAMSILTNNDMAVFDIKRNKFKMVQPGV